MSRFARAAARFAASALRFRASSRRVLVAGFAGLVFPIAAQATLTVTPLTWNVVGLDSNSPASGPEFFPVGARVCSNVATTNVAVNWTWDTANANINLRAGSLNSITLASIGANACADAYFEIQVNQVPAAYDTLRRYHISATDGSGSVSTPTPREIYVEHLISQNRNSITGVKLNGVSIPAGGSMNLLVGNTYTIELDGGTATQGYNQFEAFINFPNTIFQVLSVSTTYSADNSPYVPGPAPIASDKLYADACKWESDPTSPNYRSCVGGDFKAGGATVVTTYTIKVISGGGTSQTLNSLLYDFSGSSYHYNSDFGVNAVIANIVDPTGLNAPTISKVFAPAQAVAGGTSTLTFTISNPNPSPISGASFTDPLPAVPSQMVVASPATFSTSGCGSPTFAPAAGASSISFANGTVAANSTCSVSVLVSVPATPTSGTYSNTSNHLFVGGIDTGNFASASLGLTSTTAGSGVCGLTLANWTVPNGTTANPPDLAGGVPIVKASDVSTAVASANVPGDTVINAASGQNDLTSWQTYGYKNDGNFIQFVVDTRNYTQVQMSFYVANPHGAGPTSLVLAYNNGSGPNNVLTINNPASGFTQHTFDFSGLTSTTGSTTFRLTATGANNDNSGANLNYDNIAFTGCGFPAQPTLTKAFSVNPVAVNGTATLTFTLTNPDSAQLTGAKFTDTLPAGLQVAASPSASTTCTGSPTWAPTAGSTSLTFGQTTGANIPANGSCTASVNVTATTAGPHTNVSGFISTAEGGTNTGASGSATASLTAIVPPTIAKSFSPNPIQVNGTSLLTITITNPNPSDMLTGVAFADTYPSGLVNVNPLSPAVVNTCGGSVAAVAGGNSVGLSGGALAGGASCTVSITVTSAAAATYANTSGNVAATTAGSGNTASASLTVNPPHPAIGVKKQVGTSLTGPWFDFVSVAPGASLYYQFTAENTGDVALNTFNVSDPTLAGTGADPAGCSWQTTNSPSTLPALPVATASIDPTATCVVGPLIAAAGDHPNTATAHGTNGATIYDSSPKSADYIGALPGFSLLKQIGTSATGPWSSHIGVAAGDNVFYKFTLVNTGALSLSSINVTDALVSTASCTFTDPLPVGGATTCVVGPVVATGSAGSTTTNTATGHGTNGATFDTAPSSASYSIGSVVTDLSIAKDDGTASVTAGGTTTFSITVTNNGPAEVTNATVVDTAPAGVTLGAWTCTVTNPGSGGSVTTACGAGSGSGNINTTVTMKIGAVITYSVPASIAPDATGSLSNTATVTVPAGVIDPVSSNDSATDTDTVNVVADLSVTKTDGVASAVPGASTSYTIVVSNNGPSSVTGASVSDLMPASIASDTYTAIQSGGASGFTASGSGNISDTVNMPAGSTITYTVTATISASATGTLTNTATVSVPGGVTDSNPANNSATDSDTLAPQADLAITKNDGVASVTAGASTVYTIVVTNNGPSGVTGATVTDTLPAAITSATFTAVASGGATGFTASGSGNLSDTVNMPAGSTITYTVNASISAGASGSLSNTATVSAPAGVTDTNPGNNSATDTDTITPAAVIADLSITKTDGVATATPGGSTTYTIVVTNSGPSSITGASVTDLMPAAIASDTYTATQSGGATGFTASGSGNIGDTVNMPAGSTITYTVSASVDPSATGSLTNTATVNAPAGVTDSNLANNSATDTDTLAAQVTLEVDKTDGSTSYTPGGTATYTVTVTDTGASDAANVSVDDTLPAGVTLTGAVSCVANGSASCGSVTGAAGETSFAATGASIAAGGGNSLVFTVPVAFASNLTTDPLVNTANATDVPSGATASGSDSDARSLDVTLAVVKDDGSTSYTPGGTATYTVTVTHGGVSDATDVTVADALPAGVTLTGTVTCLATGSASCGTVSGLSGETSFGATGAKVAAGPGNSLTFSAPVAFSAGLLTDPLVNTASATDVPSGASGSGFDSDTRSAQVSLTVAKTDNSATYSPGGTATYTITVGNTGVTDALDVAVADTLPAGVTLTGDVTCAPTGTATCGTVTGSAGATSLSATGATIAAGGGNTLVLTVPVAFASSLTDDPLVNSATANDLATGASGSGSDSDLRAALSGLGITKTDGSASYTPGGTATYTIVVTNAGPADATDTTVSDTLPSGVTLTANASCVPSGTATCGTVTGLTGESSFGTTGATIPAGAGNSLTFTAPVAFASSLTADPLMNTATATDPSSAPATASDSDSLNANVDLVITKTDGATTIAAGGTTTYTIVVSNNGPSDAIGASVTDTLPASFSGATWSCAASGVGATCTASGTGNISDTVNVPVGATLTYTVQATLSGSASGTVDNTSTVAAAAGETDTNLGNNSASDSDTITGGPPPATTDLSVAKADGVTTVTAGGATTYTIVVSNGGPASANSAIFTDPAASNLSVTSVTCGSASGSAACPTVPNTTVALMQGSGIVIPTLPAGGSVTFTVNATVAAGTTGTIANTASVAAPAGVTDSDLSNNSATDTDSVTVVANLALAKTDGGSTYKPGGTATYSITVTNGGPSNADNVSVTDNLPAGMTIAGAPGCVATGAATCGTLTGVIGGTSFTATGATIAAGGGNRLVYALPVSFAAGLTASQITNTATATAPAAASVATASHTDNLQQGSRGHPQPIPADDWRALTILIGLILVIGAQRAARLARAVGTQRAPKRRR